MNKLQEKLNQLKWLQQAGIEYYCSEQKDSKISLVTELKKIPKQPIKTDKLKIMQSEMIK